MKNLILLVIVAISLSFYSCELCEVEAKAASVKSNTIETNRVVTFYNGKGYAIKKWGNVSMVVVNCNTTSFIDDKGKEVIISGIFTIE